MLITVLTLFPDMFSGPFDASIVKRAKQRNIVNISYVNIRDFATDKHKTVDGRPYGGGAGMLLRVDIVDRALQKIKHQSHSATCHTILLDPQGTQYNQKKAKELSTCDHLILVCGHYEGVDERIRSLVDEEISIGDYILTCGEIPAMVLVDSIVRLLPGTLKKEGVTTNESFSNNTLRLEYPQYTTPRTYKRKNVPEILLSGHHKNITSWQQEQSEQKTRKRRNDLFTEKTDQ